MKLKNKLLAALAIICVLCSAGAVCAGNNSDLILQDNGIYIDDAHDGYDDTVIPPDNTHDEASHAAGADPYLDGSQDGHNGTIISHDANHSDAAMNKTAGNATHAAGENVAGNSTNATAHNNHKLHNNLPATGNPVIALLAVCGILGGYAVIRKK